MSSITRQEEIEIKLALDSSAAKRHERDLKELLDWRRSVCGDDTLHVRYKFAITYFGDVARKLKAINNLVSDRNIVHEASVAELRHGRSIVVDVVANLTRIIDQLEGGKPKKRWWWK